VVGTQAEGNARCHAVAMDFRRRPGRRILAPALLVAVHDVQAQGGGFADALVEVSLQFEVAVGANRGFDLVDAVEHRRLADLVDYAAGLAATEQHRRRAAQHVDLLQVEDLAVVLRGVAHAVEIHVAEGVEAAQHHVVARTPALGGIERETGNVAQRLAQRTGILLVEQGAVTVVMACGTSCGSCATLPTRVLLAR
jgi:hypothetical protein